MLEASFRGTQFALFGESNRHGGYAKITLRDQDDREIFSTRVDFYCNYTTQGIRFISPYLTDGDYKLEVEVTGEIPEWTNKAGTIHYGSDNSYVTIEKIQYIENPGYSGLDPVTKTVTGTITSFGMPLVGATVTIRKGGKEFSAITGADGIYSIPNVPLGAGYTLTVSRTGYESKSVANFMVPSDDEPGYANFDLLFEAPVPVSDVILNPSFENGSYKNDSNYTTPVDWILNATLVDADVQLKNSGASAGTYRYYIWGEPGSSIDFYQDIVLSTGQYILKVALRPNTPSETFVYVTIDGATQKVESLGSWSALGDTSTIFIIPAANTTVRIGVESKQAVMIDNVRLFTTVE